MGLSSSHPHHRSSTFVLFTSLFASLTACGDGDPPGAPIPSDATTPLRDAASTDRGDTGNADGDGGDLGDQDAGDSGRVCPGDHDLRVDVAGYVQAFRVHVPRGAPGPVPIVVQLHGAGSSGEEMERITGLSLLADREGFVVVTPEGAGDTFRTWNAGTSFGDSDHVAALSAAVERTHTLVGCEGNPLVDPTRVYVAGQSNGAMMAYRLACERSDLVRAIVSGAGFTANDDGSGTEVFPCELERPVAVLQMNGGRDRCVPIDGRGEIVPSAEENVAAWRERNGCDAEGSDETDAFGVRRRRWACRGGAAVEWITEDAHGHAWAGSDPTIGMSATACGPPSENFSATAELWRFFEAH
ncbi:MAG: prolyl oligopeptidase family serine peptidase [Sandaracinus sp.]|nr:prolyl oligopeptidase family serine peptidase [Sandaracinus sp.]MCB9613183.1 prolyl oligopeptidase family serine peptidase [Sandaracinus sp.]MCB9636174.1 prolyl oligopeptidase family serine peptidase [Sandaracinus sp.]